MFSLNIKRLREKKDVTQERLARLLGVSRQAVSMWEANKREPDITMLNKIASFFNVTVDEIVKPKKIGKKGGDMGIKFRQRKSILTKIGKEDKCMATNTTAQRRIDFELMAPKANRVALTGDFNSWDKSGITMKRASNGLWKAWLNLKPGRYEYKFIVDGQWWTDPNNRHTAANSFGSLNSVKEISTK